MLEGNGYLAQEYFVGAYGGGDHADSADPAADAPVTRPPSRGRPGRQGGRRRDVAHDPVAAHFPFPAICLVKWTAGVIFAAVLVLVLGGTALGLRVMWFPWKGISLVFSCRERYSMF